MRAVAVALLVATLTACTPDAPPGSGGEPSPTGVDVGAGDLAALLFDDVPPGWVVVAEETGPLTLDEVVAGSDDPSSERRRLVDHGFVRGYARSWTSDDDAGDVIFAFVYEFADGAGARADLDAGVGEARDDGHEFFEVPGIDGATGVTRRGDPAAEEEDATFHAVFFVRGRRLYLVVIGGTTERPPREAIDLAAAMAGRAL